MSGELDGTEFGIANAAALIAEIDRDLAEREAEYPERMNKGRLDPKEADYLLLVVREIRADLLDAFAPIGSEELRGGPDWTATPRVAWLDKVRWIQGERDRRREKLPPLVAKGRLTETDAKRRIAAMVCLHRLYWNQMFQWRPPEGPALEYLKALQHAVMSGLSTELLGRSEGGKLYRQLVREHVAAVEADNGEAQGRLVA